MIVDLVCVAIGLTLSANKSRFDSYNTDHIVAEMFTELGLLRYTRAVKAKRPTLTVHGASRETSPSEVRRLGTDTHTARTSIETKSTMAKFSTSTLVILLDLFPPSGSASPPIAPVSALPAPSAALLLFGLLCSTVSAAGV